ncbi:MAG: AI-2E family transporter [bacterium]|nr:AI-2E family transporter [bacterium]
MAEDSKSEAKPHWSDRHLWQIQPVRDVLGFVLLVSLLLLGERLSLVTVPLLLSLLFAYLFEPLVRRMVRIPRVGRVMAVSGIVAVGAIGVVVPVCVALGFGLLQGIDFAGDVAQRAGTVIESVARPDDQELRAALGDGVWRDAREFIVELRDPAARGEHRWLETFGVDKVAQRRAAESVLAWVKSNGEEIAAAAIGTGHGALIATLTTLGSLGALVFGAFLTAFFFFYWSTGWPDLVIATRGLVPKSNRERVLDILGQMDRAVNGFVRGRLTVAVVLGVFYTIGFALIGVPAPLIIGPALSLVTIVPYAALAAVPVIMVLLGLQDLAGFRGELWWVIVAPLVWYQIAQALDDYVLTPMIQGKATGLDTPTILFSSIAGGILLGIFGLLVAIPLAACTRILFKEVVWPRVRPGREPSG